MQGYHPPIKPPRVNNVLQSRVSENRTEGVASRHSAGSNAAKGQSSATLHNVQYIPFGKWGRPLPSATETAAKFSPQGTAPSRCTVFCSVRGGAVVSEDASESPRYISSDGAQDGLYTGKNSSYYPNTCLEKLKKGTKICQNKRRRSRA
jgi:hypothetical protein